MDGDTTNQTKSSPTGVKLYIIHNCQDILSINCFSNNFIITEESDRVDHFPSGMVEATELSGGIILSQQLITGQRTDHLDIRARPECKLCIQPTH